MPSSLPVKIRPTSRPRRPTLAALCLAPLCALALSACSGRSDLPERLRQEFRPGLSIAEAREKLTAHGTTYSIRNTMECEGLVRNSPIAALQPPQGGLCIFGKIPVSKSWFGVRSDVILQLVFSGDGVLQDGNFEEVTSAQ